MPCCRKLKINLLVGKTPSLGRRSLQGQVERPVEVLPVEVFSHNKRRKHITVMYSTKTSIAIHSIRKTEVHDNGLMDNSGYCWGFRTLNLHLSPSCKMHTQRLTG